MEGNLGHRPLPPNEPKPTSGVPPVPSWLPESARPYWEEVAPIIDGMRVLSVADGWALALLCEELVVFLNADKHVQAGELVQVCDSGYEQQTPWVTIRYKSLDKLMGMLARFGLTPADRAKVQAIGGDDGKANPLAQVLNMTKRDAPKRRRPT